MHAAKGHAHSFWYRSPPKHYLGHIVSQKAPIILIPGIIEKWHFLKFFADALSLRGHPVYAIERMGYNVRDIHKSTHVIRELIKEKNLKGVILLAHSKGGLIGKHILAFHNEEGRVNKLIAIATPFGGSRIVKGIPLLQFQELGEESEAVKELRDKNEVNSKIVSIFGEYDNHIWPNKSARLEDAKNIQVPVHGHHAILFSEKVRDIIFEEISVAAKN